MNKELYHVYFTCTYWLKESFSASVEPRSVLFYLIRQFSDRTGMELAVLYSVTCASVSTLYTTGAVGRARKGTHRS
jgi:hypothetical protein